ncbi:phage regulatory CII family protein [Aliivibrio sp. S3MY1]|uniref:phage regulatory CII family protein n=1 Tax=unclassified Aliivibrio TaxID=2645654 RepID=UPI00237A06C0|nr:MULTISPECIES: phage regulatory CII family protein [unclassified Aliivibrio]MDD9197540.1 phage regulatory CII family protein [Aliivibrio sp. S3MY1]MDD9197881.1 phage regulatory CII family protein [Aliivibrio sp. S2MY1]
MCDLREPKQNAFDNACYAFADSENMEQVAKQCGINPTMLRTFKVNHYSIFNGIYRAAWYSPFYLKHNWGGEVNYDNTFHHQ